jgi:hypothetical protein
LLLSQSFCYSRARIVLELRDGPPPYGHNGGGQSWDLCTLHRDNPFANMQKSLLLFEKNNTTFCNTRKAGPAIFHQAGPQPYFRVAITPKHPRRDAIRPKAAPRQPNVLERLSAPKADATSAQCPRHVSANACSPVPRQAHTRGPHGPRFPNLYK